MQSFGCRASFLFLFLFLMVELGSGARFPSRRTWWAKKVTNDLHITGRLTETQMKLAKESGYRSFIALSNHYSRGYIGPGDTDPTPSTTEARRLANDIGMEFKILTESSNDSIVNLEIVKEFSQTFERVPKPCIFYSENGYSAAFVALMHLLNVSRLDGTSKPNLGIDDLFVRGTALGYRFETDPNLLSLVDQLVGGSNNYNIIGNLIPASIPDWYRLPASWQIKPLYGNIYVSGQVQSNHLSFIKQLDLVVVNSRRGVKVLGKPGQEEVVLLNIRDRTGTYDSNGQPIRQTTTNLERSRIDSTLPNTYISPSSNTNYQSSNALQFGDNIGYNETIERLMMEENKIEYMNFPVGGEYTYTNGLWNAYRDELLALGRKHNVLLQCRSGYRSSVLGMLLYGCLYGHNSTQVLQRVNLYGYEFSEPEAAILALVRRVTDNPQVECQCKNIEICGVESTTVTPGDFPTTKASALTFDIGILILSVMLPLWHRRIN